VVHFSTSQFKENPFDPWLIVLLVRSLRVLDNPITMQRPSGVTLAAILFFLAASYLFVIGALMLTRPGMVSMRLGEPLLHGLELAGPYMFLVVGAAGAIIGWGLLRLNYWARWAAIVAAIAGVVMLVPSVSAAAVDFRWSLVWAGLGIMVRVAVVWYLLQEPVNAVFTKRARLSSGLKPT
jgi:hypothetical protein